MERLSLLDPRHEDSGRAKDAANRSRHVLEIDKNIQIQDFRPGVEYLWLSFNLARKSKKYIVAVDRINGVTPDEWFRRMGVTLKEEEEFGASAYAAGKSWSDYLLLPINSATNELRLDLVGYRTETFEFFVKP